MIELKNDSLIFSFPEVHPGARLEITLMRTLRIPDDGKPYPLSPGLGRFPMCHLDDHTKKVPQPWLTRGGVITPMYQSEALWLNFSSWLICENEAEYPFAVKIATGKINALTGDHWADELSPEPQDYLVAPEQPWLDGYCVEKGFIRQFVAMPLGAGYSAEEQFTGEAEFGGLQILARPMKRDVFERRFPKRKKRSGPCQVLYQTDFCSDEMGLAPGGRMHQKVYDDPFDFDDWSSDHSSRCFVHLVNSMVWRRITGKQPPQPPITSSEYDEYGLPWFDLYDEEIEALEGSDALESMVSVAEMGKKKGDIPLPENESVSPEDIVILRRGLKKGQVREGRF